MTPGAVSAHRLILRTLILAGAGIAAWAALTSAAHADTQPKPGLLSGLDGLVSTVVDGTEPVRPQPPAAQQPRPPAATPHRGNHKPTRPRAPRPPKPRPPAVPNTSAVVGEATAAVHGITHQTGATVGQLVETVTDLPDNLPSELPPLVPEAPEDTPQPVTPVPQPDRAVKPAAPQQRQAAPASPTRPESTPDRPPGARQRVDHVATVAPRQTMDVCWPDWDPAPEAPPRLTPSAIHDTADLPHGWALSPPTTRAGPVPAIDAAGRHPGSPSPSG